MYVRGKRIKRDSFVLFLYACLMGLLMGGLLYLYLGYQTQQAEKHLLQIQQSSAPRLQ